MTDSEEKMDLTPDEWLRVTEVFIELGEKAVRSLDPTNGAILLRTRDADAGEVVFSFLPLSGPAVLDHANSAVYIGFSGDESASRWAEGALLDRPWSLIADIGIVDGEEGTDGAE